MKLDEIKKHWDNLSSEYAKDLKSTTKTPTLKRLEINAIANSIKNLLENNVQISEILEVGCGNGYNVFGLSKQFPKINFTGVDYSEGMIENAEKIQEDQKTENTIFFTGDILKLTENSNINELFDLVYTNRCIINLNSIELQFKALENLSLKTKKGGYILLIENPTKTYDNQNKCREAVGLTKRTPDKYNLFIDEDKFLNYAKEELKLEVLETEDFISLHDLLLYVLIPKINGGKVDYGHPIMSAVTDLLLNIDTPLKNPFGDFGQNRLYLFKK